MMIRRAIFFASLLVSAFLGAFAGNPTATTYTAEACQGTYMPYPNVKPVNAPDSLVPLMINHVGRHGARFLSSDKNIRYLLGVLTEAEASRALTPKGKALKALAEEIVRYTAGQWGALDSLGMAEQRGIATRMAETFPTLFENGRIEALSSYSPRCIMSMYSFAHQLSRMNNKLEIYTNSGRQNSPLMRPFDEDEAYKIFRAEEPWTEAMEQVRRLVMTTGPIDKIFTREYIPSDIPRFLEAEYAVVASVGALGWPCRLQDFFSEQEYNALWTLSNLSHYLRYSASTLTSATSEMASLLLLNLIETTDAAAQGDSDVHVRLRFGHAETLMPLLALMHVPGCYYMTNYFDTVGLHWRDFYVVPMAANLQLILFRHKDNGRLYLRLDLNEKPLPLIPGRDNIYVRWETARDYLVRCLPLILQP